MNLRELLETATDMGASDLYLIPGSPAALRVEDKVIPIREEKLSVNSSIRSWTMSNGARLPVSLS